jgi:hypothetical protein
MYIQYVGFVQVRRLQGRNTKGKTSVGRIFTFTVQKIRQLSKASVTRSTPTSVSSSFAKICTNVGFGFSCSGNLVELNSKVKIRPRTLELRLLIIGILNEGGLTVALTADT